VDLSLYRELSEAAEACLRESLDMWKSYPDDHELRGGVSGENLATLQRASEAIDKALSKRRFIALR
jgi:hypothetical protein